LGLIITRSLSLGNPFREIFVATKFNAQERQKIAPRTRLAQQPQRNIARAWQCQAA
jgi:hypothetical protein